MTSLLLRSPSKSCCLPLRHRRALYTLGDAVLEAYKGSGKKVVVVEGTTVQVNQPHSLAESRQT